MITKKISKADIAITKEMEKNSIAAAHMLMYDIMVSMKRTLLEMVRNASEEELVSHSHQYLSIKTVPFLFNNSNVKSHKAFVMAYITSESGADTLMDATDRPLKS